MSCLLVYMYIRVARPKVPPVHVSLVFLIQCAASMTTQKRNLHNSLRKPAGFAAVYREASVLLAENQN